ncbi:D-alanyl-D-alanine carboxypeptidase family protein [Ureibacillus acetophenoni]|uniref:D-alanyl-D-alanine carboxypeptidase n=1 Tax=Ureibacillus acetophenoni TaxID=614649 RepID=A0A285UGJ9_9BACL|nr:D-alanyl-D-alanine carboxypeptidase family protein [Ureibacillus acetophenoni]SOC40932.1 D-alanyl-D-alanine carboxypeptidase [Ureibacillus acetophenoni]
MRKIILLMITLIVINSFITLKTYAQDEPSSPKLISEAAIVLEANSGQVLYEKNAKQQMYPASLTKIATAIYAIEKGNLNDVVTVSDNARNVDGTRVYLEEGEKVSLEKLVQGLLINSGNDAGVAIAEHMSGNVEKFGIELNRYLGKVIGVRDTHFVNPHGLFDAEHTTTAKDLAKITQYAMKNETFRNIFGAKEFVWNGEAWDTTLITHHKILKGEFPYEGVTGGKTGYVNESGFTLATTAEKDNLSLIVITLNSYYEEQSYQDTLKLLDFSFENFTTTSVEEGTTFTVGNEEFINNEALTTTAIVNDKIVQKIESDGKLNLVNQEGIVVASYQLEKINTGEINTGEINHSVELANSSNNEVDKMMAFDTKVFSFIIVLIASVGIVFHLKRKYGV